MSEYYATQNLTPLIGATLSSNGVVALSPVTLTATAADNRGTIQVKGVTQLILLIRYITSTTANKILDMTVEFSPDGTLFYQEASEEASTTVVTEYLVTRRFTGVDASTTYSMRVAIPVADVDRIRIGFRETTGTPFGTLSCLSILSGQ